MKDRIFFICSIFLLTCCADQDPRLPGTTASVLDFQLYQDSFLYLPEGWTATLWAESPQLYNPTNMDVDHRGRIWITEAVNYRDFNNKPGKFPHFDAGDRVVILEDTDGDGRADQSKVYVQDPDLVAPLGIAVIGNQVIVSCAPNLIIYTDTDGDDRPDTKEILLTGFGGYDHDHSLHALLSGPDGKWYFNTGNAGPNTVTDRSGWTLRSGSLYTGGTPYNQENNGNRQSDGGRVWVGGLALRINPDGTGLEVLSHNFRNAYELAVDSYGDLWQNDNDDQVETCRTTWLMYGSNAGYFSADGSRYWQADQRPGQSTFAAHWHQDDPGVLPAGDNTGAGSPTGVLVYEGETFGEQFVGMLLSVDAGRNQVFAYQPQLEGAGYTLDRKELISSVAESTAGYIWNELPEDRRKWFRPSDMVAGTDGSLYIADWYDPVVGGHQMHDTSAYGRIFRITPTDKILEKPSIDLSSTAGQIEALCSPAINVRSQGFMQLREQGAAVIPSVRALLQSANRFHRARAVWLLAQLGSEGQEIVVGLLEHDSDPRLRVAAYRALVQAVPERLLELASFSALDPAPAVRRAIAVSLRDTPLEECQDILIDLYESFDGADRWYLEALGTALEGKEAAFYELLRESERDPEGWHAAFAALTWRLHPSEALSDLDARCRSESLTIDERLVAMAAIGFIPGREAAETMINLAAETLHPRIRSMAEWWVEHRLSNLWLDAVDWKERDTIHSLPDSIISAENNLLRDEANMGERVQAALTLARHPEGGKMILQLAAKGKLPAPVLADSSIARALSHNSELEVRVLSGEFFSRSASAKLSITRIVQLKGRVAEGKQIFGENCSICHRIGDTGQDIGPRLENIQRKFDKAALADAIINPGSAVAFGFEPYIVTTKQGQAITGFLLSDGEVTTIKDLTGKRHTILAEVISDKTRLNSSLMPDAINLGLKEMQVADIMAYLYSL